MTISVTHFDFHIKVLPIIIHNIKQGLKNRSGENSNKKQYYQAPIIHYLYFNVNLIHTAISISDRNRKSLSAAATKRLDIKFNCHNKLDSNFF